MSRFRWTKGVTATGVVGENVVKLLEDAIARDGVSSFSCSTDFLVLRILVF